MRLSISIIILLISNFFYSQQSNKLSADLLNFPSSPEAAKMATYGNVPVNTFYGKLNYSINLFQQKIGDFDFPVNLSYNYSGNRPEETPSIIGLGWQLNTGGVVTREVRGLPDEHPRGINSASVKNIMDEYFNNGVITYQNSIDFANGVIDSEPDKYSVSVNNINFSFKIGNDGNPVFLWKHDNNLQIIRNTNDNNIIEKFILTDNKANQYVFEEKEINTPFYGYGAFFDEDFQSYTSSWQLSLINVNNGSTINFEYQNDDFKTYSFYASLEKRPVPPPNSPFHSPAETYNQGCTSDIIKRKLLKSIKTSYFNILFDISQLNDCEVYSKITLKDYQNKIIDYYDFNYFDPRNQLDKIAKNGRFFYDFDYYGTVSGFINSEYSYPKNQDEWGFENLNTGYPVYCQGTIYQADKKPDFNSTLKGALSGIKYQTGGYTQITYEQNTINSTEVNNDYPPNSRVQVNLKSDNNWDAPAVKERIETRIFNSPVVASLSNTISDVNFIDMSIKNISTTIPPGVGVFNAAYDTSNVPYYILIPLARSFSSESIPAVAVKLSEIAQIDSNCLSFNNCSRSENSSGKFILPAGEYEFKIKTDFNKYKDVQGEIILDFYDPAVALVTQDVYNKPVGGVRVKQVITGSNNSDPIIKNFDYNYSDGTSSGGLFGRTPLNYETLSKETCCADRLNQGGGTLSQFVLPTEPNLAIISSKSNNLSMLNNSPIFYASVIEYGERIETITRKRFLGLASTQSVGSNWDDSLTCSYIGPGTYGTKSNSYPKGFNQKKYLRPLLKYSEFPYVPTGTNLSVGLTGESINFSKSASNTQPVELTKETNLYFNTENESYKPLSIFDNPNYPKSMKVAYKVKLVDGSMFKLPYTINDFFYFKKYKDFDIEQFLYSTNTIENFGGNVLEKNTTIEYDSHFQQKKITTSDSQKNILTTEISYPYDFSDAISLDMVSRNFVAPTVKIVNKKNGEITDTYKYEFNSIGFNLFKPFSFWQSKYNDPLEKKKIFFYDSYGNITSMAQVAKDVANPHGVMSSVGELNTQVVWGYESSLPVVKIEAPLGTSPVIPYDLIDAIEFASSADGSESALFSALSSLRNHASLANCMVTTYTYIPLVGIKTMTNPLGQTTTYIYDEFNRLKQVKDHNGNILNENQYNYRQQ